MATGITMNRTAIALAGLGLLLMSGTPATAWTTDISLSSEGRTEVLTLGSEDGASDGFDAGMDVPLPPPPPSSPFSAHLVGNGLFEMLQTEIRATHSWSIYVASMGEIDIAWNAAPVPLTMTLGEDQFSLTESGHHALSSGEYRISIQGAQSPASSGPAGGSGGDSSSSGSTVLEKPPAAAPAASPDQVQGSMPLPPATLTPDTPVHDTSDLTPERHQAPRPAEANQAPGFGALLTLLGVGVLIFTLKNRQMQ
jgi:hypothetical protein